MSRASRRYESPQYKFRGLRYGSLNHEQSFADFLGIGFGFRDLDFETIVISSETEKGQVLRYHDISFFQSSGVVTLCKILTSKSMTVVCGLTRLQSSDSTSTLIHYSFGLIPSSQTLKHTRIRHLGTQLRIV